MRPLLIVGFRLLGVMVLYWSLQHIQALLFTVAFFFDGPPANAGYLSPGLHITFVCLSLVLSVAFGAFLLFRGERLAARLPLSDSSNEIPDMKSEQLLSLGIIIGGVLIASTALPKLLVEVYVILTTPQVGEPNSFVSTLYGPLRPFESVLQLAVAAVLIFRSGWVISIVTRYGQGAKTIRGRDSLHSDPGENPRG